MEVSVLSSGSVAVPTQQVAAGRRSLATRPCAVATGRRGGTSAINSNGSGLRSNQVVTVGEFMTRRDNLRVVKPNTAIEAALQMLVEDGISGFPVIDDGQRLVGVVSDYDLLALDSISGKRKTNANLFPDVNSSWESFHEIQKLLSKNHGKVVSDVMTASPLVLRESTNFDDAARLLLETKHHRLPVVDASGKLVGVITRGSLMRAAVQMKRESQTNAQA